MDNGDWRVYTGFGWATAEKGGGGDVYMQAEGHTGDGADCPRGDDVHSAAKNDEKRKVSKEHDSWISLFALN